MLIESKIKIGLLTAWFMLWGCIASFATDFGEARMATPPSYQFRSTSSCTSVVGASAIYQPEVTPAFSAPSRPRRSGWGDPESENEQELGQVDTPIGEPMVLLLMALLYALGHYFARRKHIIYNKQ